MESFVKYLRQLSSIFRICEYTFKGINIFFFFSKIMKFEVQNNFIFLWRSSSWYVGGSCQLQHHCQGVEAFVQHASRRKWNLGKLWSDKTLSVIPLEPEVDINCLLGDINLVWFFFFLIQVDQNIDFVKYFC